MNYADIVRINHPDYVLTHVGDGTDYDVITWSIYNTAPNPIPKATLDAEIAAAVGSNAGELADLTISGEQELYAFSNLDETAGLVRKLGHASYTLDANVYITGITSTNVTDALGFTPYDAANPSVYATKSYVDSLNAQGVNWIAPVKLLNLIGCTATPPSTPIIGDAYMIAPDGNIDAWATFAVGDTVQYKSAGWLKVDDYTTLAVNNRFIIGAVTATPGVGFALGYDNQIATITGNISSNCETITWAFTMPADNDAAFVNNPQGLYYGYSYLYDTTDAKWNEFQAPTSVVGGNAITMLGTTINVDYGPGTTIYNDTIAVLPYIGGGLMNTLDGTSSSSNKEAGLSLTKVGAAGTYQAVVTDAFGRVTSGSNPTTLAGFGITDAVAASQLGTALGVATLDASAKLTATQLPTHNQQWSTITNTPTSVSGYGIIDAVSTSQLGIASGIATLDAGGKLTTAQIPASVIGAMNYQGAWNASTNIPSLTSGVGTKGYYYKVSVAGATNIDGFTGWSVGDLIVFNGVIWDAIQGGSSDVTTVFGRTGSITATLASADFANQGTSTTVLHGGAAGNPTWSAVNLATDVTGTLPMSATSALTGDVTKASGGSILTLATVNTSVGTYGATTLVPQITVNSKGLVTSVVTVGIPTAITLTGDITASGSVNGTTATTLTSTGVIAGTYGSSIFVPQFVVDGKGRLTSASNISIPNSIGITGDATATITTGSSGTLTLATVNTNVGVFGSDTQATQFTVNSKGLITAIANVTIPNTITLTGDGSASVITGGASALTLATVNSDTGIFGSSNAISQITINAKGLITNASNVAITSSGIGAVANDGGTPSVQSGLKANRPVPGTTGRVYIATDNGLIYRDTGTTWDIIGIGNDGSGNGGIYQSITGVYGAQSGTTLIPADATVPLNTEGTAIWTGIITPNSAGSKIRVSSSFWMDCNTNGRSVTVALFRNGVCIQAQNSYFKNIGQPMQVALEFVDSPESNIAITYSCRVGINNSGTWFINQNQSNTINYGGAVNTSTYVLMEIL